MTLPVTDAQVKGIIELSTGFDTEPFILMADTLIQYLISNVTSFNNLGGDMHYQIELNVAAHYCAMKDQRLSEKTLSKSEFKFQGDWGMGFDGTSYGQTALDLGLAPALKKTKRPPIQVAQGQPF